MSNLPQKRKDGRKTLKKLCDDPENTLIIHYSCESFSDRPGGTTARITSIAVRRLDNALTSSFAIHLVAEREKIPSEQIVANYDLLERKMLKEFCAFMVKHQSCNWVHWNMRDSNYGFSAIYHRARVLGNKVDELPEGNLVDLARCLVDIYGMRYIGHPRLKNLLKLNEISDLAFLEGEAEAQAFERKDYVAVHRSTLRKVDAFESILCRANQKTLKSKSRFWHIYGTSLPDIVTLVKEHWLVSLVGVLMLGVGVWKFISSLLSK